MSPIVQQQDVRRAPMFWRLSVVLGLAGLLTLLSTVRVSLADTRDRPNIVFILADDLGWADTTLYGQTKFHQTPNLERLAKRGMLFTQAYAASPLCSPTRASILTGMNPARTGITSPSCHLPEVRLTASVKKSAPANVKTLICDNATRLKTEYVTLRFRVRTPADGAAKIEWLPSGAANKPDGAQSVPYKLNAGERQDVRVDLPARGALGIVRLHLPTQKEPVEIDWIELKSTGQPRRWDFE